jgi:CRP-like cAMP-binding protein
MNRTDLIKNTYLFRGMSGDDLNALLTIVEQRVLKQGELAYDAGQDPDAIFIIEMGTVEYPSRETDALFATLGNRQTFGELAFSAR